MTKEEREMLESPADSSGRSASSLDAVAPLPFAPPPSGEELSKLFGDTAALSTDHGGERMLTFVTKKGRWPPPRGDAEPVVGPYSGPGESASSR